MIYLPNTHALLSASGSHRWMHCPPSARLEEKFPESTSTYADEGTFAHELGELILQFSLNLIKTKDFKIKFDAMKTGTYYSEDLLSYVNSYVSIVMERYAEAKAMCKDATILLEQKLDFSQWVPEGFGTGDVVIIADGVVEIIDLKYGKGVQVSAENNPQLMLYGVGALDTYGFLYDSEIVRMTIIQPRLDSISSFEMKTDELYQWAEDVVLPKSKLAFEGKGEFCSGDHCRFCRAKVKCRARAEKNLELAQLDFKKPDLLEDAEIAEILGKCDELASWAKDISAYAFEQAEKGKKWAGWKLVEGRSNRCYTDKEKVATKLLGDGYEENKIYEKSLLGITAMEKLLGKKVFEQVLDGLVIKPAGKPTLVEESDKRPEINSTQSAISDFKE